MIRSVIVRVLPIILFASLVTATPLTAAYAYMDPGTGGMLLQLLLGGVAGGLVILKLYWHRLRESVGRVFGRPNADKTKSD